MQEIRDKQMGILKAAKDFEVSKSTKFRLVADQSYERNVATSKSFGRKPVFSPELEE